MGFIHDRIDFVAGDEFPRAVCRVMDKDFGNAIGDRLGDLGASGSIEVDDGFAVLASCEGWELRANTVDRKHSKGPSRFWEATGWFGGLFRADAYENALTIFQF